MIHPDVPALALAPMEGVTDAPMRAVQGAAGAFSYAVTEFLRVSHAVPPRHVFLDHVPELAAGAVTPTGLSVQVQLLGGDPGRMAESAARAVELGAAAIDLNFGCPAPTVNRHDGGAALLRHPERIRAIVAAVRAALPPAVPVSAKLRLGWDTTDAIDTNAAMAAEGGAAWLTIHGRTRVAGYAPPIHWEPIGRVRARLGLPVVANGDIWTLDDFKRCRDVTGCRHFMLGRGALADPRLAGRVAAELGLAPRAHDSALRLAGAGPSCGAGVPPASSPAAGGTPAPQPNTGDAEGPVDWVAHLRSLVEWSHRYGMLRSDKDVSRLKQWLRLAAQFGSFEHFDRVKRLDSVGALFAELERAAGYDSPSRISAATADASAPPLASSA